MSVPFPSVHAWLIGKGWVLQEFREDRAVYQKSGVAALAVDCPGGLVDQVDFETLKAIVQEEAEPPPFGFGPRKR